MNLPLKLRHLLLAFLCTLTCFVAAQSYTDAHRAYREGQNAEAYRILRDLLEANPESSDARLLLAYVYQRLGAHTLAEETFSALLEESVSADAHYGLALSQRSLGKTTAALQNAQRALELSSTRDDVRALTESLEATSPGLPILPPTVPLALPLVLVVLLMGVHAFASRLMSGRIHRLRDRLCATAVLVLASPIAIVAVLGQAQSLTHDRVLSVTLFIAALAMLDAGREGRQRAIRDLRAVLTIMHRAVTGGAWVAALMVGAVTLGVAAWAAYLLVPWAWDALGHHLPIVHDAIQTRGLREIPTNNPYINTYPLAINLFYTWWRLLLPDDTLIDLAQMPFGLAACLVIAALARRGGVPAPRAVALSFLFLTIPVAALQLASNYTDIAYAALLLLGVYFVTGPLDRASAAFGAIALGLLLTTKPSAPIALVIVFTVMLIHAYRLRRVRVVFVMALAVLAIGSSRYIENFMRYGNPVWPVQVQFGPITLPGEVSLGRILDNNVPEPYVHYSWLGRTVGSWFAWPEQYSYSMRIGGFGPLFMLGLLPFIFAAVRWRPPPVTVLAITVIATATLATQWAHMSRHTLALPAALLVLAASVSQLWPHRWRVAADLYLAALAAWGLFLVLPDFTNRGPSLIELSRLPVADRAAAFGGIDGHERQWHEARGFLLEGEAFGYDRTFGLAGLLWRPDGRGRVAYMPPSLRTPEDLLSWLERERVRVVVLGDDDPYLGPWARSRPGQFIELFDCPFDPCAVYLFIGSGKPSSLDPVVRPKSTT